MRCPAEACQLSSPAKAHHRRPGIINPACSNLFELLPPGRTRLQSIPENFQACFGLFSTWAGLLVQLPEGLRSYSPCLYPGVLTATTPYSFNFVFVPACHRSLIQNAPCLFYKHSRLCSCGWQASRGAKPSEVYQAAVQHLESALSDGKQACSFLRAAHLPSMCSSISLFLYFSVGN